ncbi:hypothetical protein EH105704_03_00670 [Atlantibacter hermannii NBRC 105704]|uniref:Uncharacterized protein n=1 Tax=Atlantibacter hermannii NBRC 105704 TaxID=1115512 RepID=H5V0Q5_ATLHE|nr:hypothetical protein EH105704_03_00670 [Atlantibacter hermannii NBRC 105704]
MKQTSINLSRFRAQTFFLKVKIEFMTKLNIIPTTYPMAFDKNKLNPKNVNVIITTAVNNVFPPPTIQYLTNSGVLLFIMLYFLRLTM